MVYRGSDGDTTATLAAMDDHDKLGAREWA